MATFSENAVVDMIDFYKDHDWNDIEVVREAVIQNGPGWKLVSFAKAS